MVGVNDVVEVRGRDEAPAGGGRDVLSREQRLQPGHVRSNLTWSLVGCMETVWRLCGGCVVVLKTPSSLSPAAGPRARAPRPSGCAAPRGPPPPAQRHFRA
jgi:hypothetical protein